MFRKLSDTPLKLDQSLIGLKEEHSAFIFNKGFLLESRFWAGCPFNEGSFLGSDKMGEALILKCSANARCGHESMLGTYEPL
jgi:hypothetical protein